MNFTPELFKYLSQSKVKYLYFAKTNGESEKTGKKHTITG